MNVNCSVFSLQPITIWTLQYTFHTKLQNKPKGRCLAGLFSVVGLYHLSYDIQSSLDYFPPYIPPPSLNRHGFSFSSTFTIFCLIYPPPSLSANISSSSKVADNHWKTALKI